MAELTAYDKKRQEEYKKFLAEQKRNRNKPAQVSDAQRRRARDVIQSSMYYRRPDLQQSLANAQETNRAKKEANKKESNQLRDIINRTETPSIQNMTVEQLQALRRENEDEQFATLYRNNPNFDTDTPPARGTRAREIWDRENQRRLDEKQRKINKDYENQADYLLAVPNDKTASANPRTNLRTEKFDPNNIRPQGDVFNFIDYDKMVDREAQSERERLDKERLISLQGNFDERSSDEITQGMMDNVATKASRKTNNRGEFDQRSSAEIEEGLLSNLATRRSRKMGMQGDLPDTTSKQYEQRIKSQVGLSEEIEKAQRAAMGRGTQSEINRQRALRAPEVEDGEFAEKNRMEGLYQEDLKPTNKKAKLEEITINATDIAEQLDEEGITDPEERKAVKEQVGNYFRDTSTNQLINLDRLQAEMDTIQKREDLFATAQLLSGKSREKFMINNNLVDEDDIPAPTKLDELEKTLKHDETVFKIAEIAKKTEDLNKPGAKKLSEEQKAMVDVGKEYLKEGDVDNARAAFEAAGVKMPNFKVDSKKASEALIQLAGGTMDLSKYGVATEKGLEKFFDDYRRDKRELLKGMSSFKYASVDGFTIEKKTKSIPYFKSAGVPLWEELQEMAGKEGPVNNFNFIQDSSLRRRLELAKPEKGFQNETEYISAVTDIVYDRQLDRLTDGFHSEYLELTEAGKGDQPLLTPGFKKGSDTGGEGAGSVEEIPGGDFDSTMGDETDLDVGEGEGLLKKALARKDENVESSPGAKSVQNYVQGKTLGKGLPDAIDFIKETWDNRKLRPSEIAKQQQQQNQELVTGQEQDNRGVDIIPKAGASELGQPISDMILNDPLNEQFTFGDFTDGRRGVENLQAFDRTQRFEGKFTPKIRQEFFEKKKGERRKPVMANGKPVYHIGYGIRLPLNKKEVQVLRSNGFKGNPNEFLKAPTKAHAKKLQGDKYAITENQAEALMKHRYANHIRDLIKSNQEFAKENGKINQNKVINWSGLPRQVREVLFDMSYNIGPRFLTRKQDPFKNLRQSILDYQASPTRENVEKMVVDIRESKYYREQVGNRASANMQTLLDLIN